MTYGNRLQKALALAGKDRAQLAQALEISVQAVGQVIVGSSRTKSFTAANSAKAAQFLGVNHYWLATGEGLPLVKSDWPFTMIDRAQYDALDAEQRGYVQSKLDDAIQAAMNRQNLKQQGQAIQPSRLTAK